MRHLYLLLTVFGLMISTFSYAGQVEYDDCILKYLKGAKLDMATNYIRRACNENFKNPNFASNARKEYNRCLLSNLVGIESVQAVMEINKACQSKHK